MAITLRMVTERAQDIHRSLTDRFDIEYAKQETTRLYQEGVQLVTAEVKGQPLIPDIVSSVVGELNSVIPLQTTQHQTSLHGALSKTYRIFVELTWYQCWRKKEMPVFTETRNTIIENSKLIISILPKNHIDMRFEYSCAKQAAKCLTPAESIWSKYLDHVLEMGEAAEGVSLFGIVKAFKTLALDAGKDWIKGWYPDVHYLRWVSISVKTTKDFNDIIGPELHRFKEKGNQHTLCLATVFVDILKNPDVEENARELAARGLADLLHLEDRDRVSRFLNGALKKLPHAKPLKEAVKKEDRYWKTRSLIMQHLEELIRDSKYKKYLYESIAALVSVDKKSRNEDEKKEIQSRLNALQEENSDLQQFVSDLNEFLEAARGNSRGGNEDEIQQAETDIQKALEDKESIERELEQMGSINTVLEEIDREEEGHLKRILDVANA